MTGTGHDNLKDVFHREKEGERVAAVWHTPRGERMDEGKWTSVGGVVGGRGRCEKEN